MAELNTIEKVIKELGSRGNTNQPVVKFVYNNIKRLTGKDSYNFITPDSFGDGIIWNIIGYYGLDSEDFFNDWSELIKQEKIDWLKKFIKRWDKIESTADRRNMNDELEKLEEEYDEFLELYEIPKDSGDAGDLLISLQKEDKMENTKLDLINSQIEFVENHIERVNDLENELNSAQRFKLEASLNEDYDSFLKENNLESYSMATPSLLLEDLIKGKEELEKQPEVELTAFNDADLFIKEYKDYLIGKNINFKSETENSIAEKKYKIKDVQKNVHDEISGENSIVLITEDFGDLSIGNYDFKSFIDGEELDNNDGTFTTLILQEETIEEPKKESQNHDEFKYYVVININNEKASKIKSGHEYREDAEEALEKCKSYGEKNVQVLSKKALGNHGIDPYNVNDWDISSEDYSIIEEAINFGVTEGEYTEESAKNYIERYKNEGKYLMVIKARLVYYLEHAEKHFRKAIVNSEYEKALRFRETKERIENELLSIIKRDV